MLKAILYLGLSAVAIIACLVSPFYGLIAVIEAYLLNPVALGLPDGEFRYQFWITIAFLVGAAWHWMAGQRGGPGGYKGSLIALWCFVGLGALSATWAVISWELALHDIFELFKTTVVTTVLVAVVVHADQMKTLMRACLIGLWHASFMHTFGVKLGYVQASLGREEGVLPDMQTPVLLLFLPVAMILAVKGDRTDRWLARFVLPFAINSLIYTYQRTGFVALLLEVALVALFLPKRTLLAWSPLALAFGIFVGYRLMPENYWDWISTVKTPTEEKSANSRFVVNQASVEMLMDHPFGVGYRNYPQVSPRYLPTEYLTGGQRSAHNSFFSVACETGVPGILLWIFVFGRTVLLLRAARRDLAEATGPRATLVDYARGIEIGLFGWLAAGWFHAIHEVDPAYWFVGMAIVLRRLSVQGEPADEGAEGTGELTNSAMCQ